MSIPVRRILEDATSDLRLRLIAGESGLDHKLRDPRIQKTGLALTGFVENIHPGRLQIFGNNEVVFLKTLSYQVQIETLKKLCTVEIPAFVITRNLETPTSMIEVCDELGITLMTTDLISSVFIDTINRFLEDNLAPMATFHGVLMEILGIGILLMGKSGVGKSECALDLLMRGYRLVADDVVYVHKTPPSTIWGSASARIRHFMEIRGLGIINVHELFGITAVRRRKKIELVLELMEWDRNVEYDRLGLESKTFEILGVELPYRRLPISQGRNIASLVEVAARLHLLSQQGVDTAERFRSRIERPMEEPELTPPIEVE